MAKNLITARGHTYTEQHLDTPKKVELFKAEYSDIKTVPQIDQDGMGIGTWDNLKSWFDA